MVAASTVVDVASVDIGDMAMDLWEPFRMYLVLKEVTSPPRPALPLNHLGHLMAKDLSMPLGDNETGGDDAVDLNSVLCPMRGDERAHSV